MAAIIDPGRDVHGKQSAPSPFFDEATERRLAADDAFAWRSVTGVLITIVAVGLLIGVFAVVVSA